jgi:hypothetical protein
MATKIVKVRGNIQLLEVTQSDGTKIITRAYSVGTRGGIDHKQFSDMGSAGAYFDNLVLQSLNSPK